MRDGDCAVAGSRLSIRALGYDPASPQKDLSFSDVDNAGTAPKCVVTHADFDWQGDQPLRHPWDVDRHLRAARARLHHPSHAPALRFPGRIAV